LENCWEKLFYSNKTPYYGHSFRESKVLTYRTHNKTALWTHPYYINWIKDSSGERPESSQPQIEVMSQCYCDTTSEPIIPIPRPSIINEFSNVAFKPIQCISDRTHANFGFRFLG
jgi:hypothetical protein